MGDVDDAFVKGQAAAHRKQQHRNDQPPEIEFLPVSEWVLLVRGLLAAAHPEQQQQLVAGIDHGVKGLGQHGGAAGDDGGREFGDGDDQVGCDRTIDGDRLFPARIVTPAPYRVASSS